MALSNWAVGIWKGGRWIGDTNVLDILKDFRIRVIKDSIKIEVDMVGKECPFYVKPNIELGESYTEMTIDKNHAPVSVKLWTKRFDAPYPRIYFLAKITDHSGNITTTERACGIGTYGYTNNGHWVGITNKIFSEFGKWIKTNDGYPFVANKISINLSSAVLGFKIGLKDKKLAVIVTDKKKAKEQSMSLGSCLERRGVWEK